MTWPTGTRVNDLSINDPPTTVLNTVWDCLSSGSSSSLLRIIFPWGQTIDSTVQESVTKTWHNPNNPNEWISFWAIGCSDSGTYGIANYGNCISEWKCIEPLTGYETDINNCGETDRYNEICEIIEPKSNISKYILLAGIGTGIILLRKK